MLIRPKQA